MRQKATPIANELQELGRRLKLWRKAHAPRARLPEELWGAAVAVAGQEGLYRTAPTLHLDYASLKRRVAAPSKRATAARTRGRRETAPTAFVELLAGSIATDCLI